MISRPRAARRYAWVALALASYAILAHYSNSNPGAKVLGALLAIAPPLLLALGLAWRSANRLAAFACAILLAALIVMNWRVVEGNFPLGYLLEEVGFYSLLSISFARTLLPGRVALCTRWAELVQGPLPAAVARYTRRTTAAWALFFALIAVVSLALYELAPLRVWSAFSNFLTLPLVALMFAGEYAVRRMVLPASHRTGLLDSVRVYLDSSRNTTIVRQ